MFPEGGGLRLAEQAGSCGSRVSRLASELEPNGLFCEPARRGGAMEMDRVSWLTRLAVRAFGRCERRMGIACARRLCVALVVVVSAVAASGCSGSRERSGETASLQEPPYQRLLGTLASDGASGAVAVVESP